MEMIQKRNYTFLAIVSMLLLIKVFDTLMAPNHVFPGRNASFPLTELLAVTFLFYIAMRLSPNIPIPDMWDSSVSNRERFFLPFGLGILCGMVFWVFDHHARIGDMNVGFPLSLPFYFWGAISTETIMHIFPVTVVLYLTRKVRGYQDVIFSIVAFLLAGIAAMSMVAAFSMPDIPIRASGPLVIVTVGILVFLTEMLTLYLFKKYGPMAPISMRMGFYAMWHILWPMIFY